MREGWQETTLGEVADVVGGGTPRTSVSDYWTGDVVWLTPTEVVAAEGRTICKSRRMISQAGLSSSGAKLLQENTVLVTSRATVGAVAMAGCQLATNQGFQSLMPRNTVLPWFLLYWVQFNKEEFCRRASGSTFPEISRTEVKGIPILLPPLDEQRRIVGLIAAVDEAIEAAEGVKSAADQARRGLLGELLSEERARREGWRETTLGETFSLEISRHTPSELDPTTPYVGLEHVVPDCKMPLLTAYVGAVSSSVTPFKPEDVLFGRLRPYLRKVALSPIAGVCTPEILVLHPSEQTVIPGYLHALASSNHTIERCIEMSAGSRMPRTSAIDLSSIPILLPPLDEQRRIVDIVSAADEQASIADSLVNTFRSLRSALLADLLSGDHEIPASYDELLSV